jgi:hypothetical protein
MNDLSPEDLIKAWQMQDNIEEAVKSVLYSGVKLGISAMSLTLAESVLQGKADITNPDNIRAIEEVAIKRALEKLQNKITSRRADPNHE